MADLTIAEELRAAASRLRENNFALLIELACPGLADPFALLVEDAAREADMNPTRAPRHRTDLTHALAVARALNGGDHGRR